MEPQQNLGVGRLEGESSLSTSTDYTERILCKVKGREGGRRTTGEKKFVQSQSEKGFWAVKSAREKGRENRCRNRKSRGIFIL